MLNSEELKVMHKKFELREECNNAVKLGLHKNFKLGNMKSKRQNYMDWLEDCLLTEREKNRQLSELLKEKQNANITGK